MQEEILVARDVSLNQFYLPQYKTIKRIPDHSCYGLKGEEFVKVIDDAYNGIITWRKNLFKLLSGRTPKLFIKELTTWLEHYNNNSDFQGIVLKMFMGQCSKTIH